MKYILLMSGTKAGVDRYHTWSQKDIETHMAGLRGITNDLTGSGEFVATQGLAEPPEAKVVRGEKNGIPVTDGIFPESTVQLVCYCSPPQRNGKRMAIASKQMNKTIAPSVLPS